MFCVNCGKEVEEGWVKCPYCGTLLKKEATPTNDIVSVGMEKTDVNERGDEGPHEDKEVHQRASLPPIHVDGRKIKYRSFWKYLLLSFVTLGIYGIYVLYGFVKDVNDICEDDGKKSPNYIIVLLLGMATCGIYTIYWWYKQGNRIQTAATRYGVSIRENGTTILIWYILGCTIMPLIGTFVATYIMFDNINRIALSYNGEATAEKLSSMGKAHPYIVRNSIIIWIVCTILTFAFLIFLASTGDSMSIEDKVKTEELTEESRVKPEKKKMNLSKDIDLSAYKNQSINELKKVITDLNNDGDSYCNADKTLIVSIDENGYIRTINIKGNPKNVPYFGQIHLEDRIEDVDKNIQTDYRIIKTESTVIDAQGNTSREYREKNTTNKLSVTYEGKSKKITEIKWLFNGVDFIFPDSSERLIDKKEIDNLTDAERQISINEIFARYGRKFNSTDVQAYFDSKEWYDGSIAPEDFDETIFNTVEKDNVSQLSGNEDKVQENPNVFENKESINGYLHINASIPSILKSPKNYIGEKVCFEGVLKKNFNGILELSYFEGGEGEIQVSAYYDKYKLTVMPDEPVRDASVVVWGTVSGANKQAGVEIQLESIYIGTNNIYFSQEATEYYLVPTFRELNYSDNFDLGKKIILEGVLQYEDNKRDYKLVMDSGRCLLSSSVEDFADVSIYQVTTMDSFLDKKVRIYGFYGGVAPLVAVEYIEPLE